MYVSKCSGQHIKMTDCSHIVIEWSFFFPTNWSLGPEARVIRWNLHLNLLIEVKTSACAVWQQQRRSKAQRTEDRKVLIVSLSVTWKIEEEFHSVETDLRCRSWNSPVSEQTFSNPQNMVTMIRVNIISHICERGKSPLPPVCLLTFVP